MAVTLINNKLKEDGYRSVLCATVHDSIVADCPQDEVIEVFKIMKDFMENLEVYNDKYSFLKGIPLLSEAEIGYSYGDAYECTIQELEEEGVKNFLDTRIAEKNAKDKKAIEKGREEGLLIPKFVPAL